jgi:hypothetical protein
MTWFPECAFTPGAQEYSSNAVAEFGPGVTITRRVWLAGAVSLATGGVAAAKPAVALKVDHERWEELVRFLHPLACDLVRGRLPNEEVYLTQVAAWLTRMGRHHVPRPLHFHQPTAAPWRFGQLFYHQPINILLVDMAPHAKIALHDHRDYNGVLFAVRGMVRVRHFEPLAEPPRQAGKPFAIRETARLALRAGLTATLGRWRDNFHEIVAGPQGARLLDVFTFFEPSARSHDVDFSDRPRPGEDDVYEVAWKGV